MDGIIKIAKSLEKSSLLIDGGTEKVKHEIKRQEGGFLRAMMAPLAVSLIAAIDTTFSFFVYKCYIWKKTRRWIYSVISIAFND